MNFMCLYLQTFQNIHTRYQLFYTAYQIVQPGYLVFNMYTIDSEQPDTLIFHQYFMILQ